MKQTKKRTVFTFLIKVIQLARKGGTVVPPSDFHKETTKSLESRTFFEKFTRPRGHTRAQTQHPKK